MFFDYECKYPKTKRYSAIMAIMITDECINCGACEPECPNTAIYEGGVEWTYAGGTHLEEVDYGDGTVVDAKVKQAPVSNEFYYIVTDKCTECMGFHEEPQCAAVCPVDCCVPDPENVEDEETLLAKKAWMHGE
ncbi:4Fe-4S ferredoxin iron-sulfur binding domain-containing protein [Runella slithyformis DSM 19594]|uniref:4Fe-4S ferredoxin iron-sulfur binding domain-containing protein n=2 Tax=Runella TaxID=105 RepID=A0A7U4E4D7_RUNSL|nr:4Fe-4S ferredoxin iron-sulfur binding domain-containing protein [Runella slithyformis DSM 19594]